MGGLNFPRIGRGLPKEGFIRRNWPKILGGRKEEFGEEFETRVTKDTRDFKFRLFTTF